jgi:phosphate transport system substrate-binding protein
MPVIRKENNRDERGRKMHRSLLYVSCAAFIISAGVIQGEEPALKGTISLSGAWAIYPTAVAWGEAFHQKFTGVRVNVSAGGAGKGVADAIAGLVDIGMVSRDPDTAEIARGIVPVYVLHDAVFPVVSELNPSLGMLMQHGIKKTAWVDMYVTGKITIWNQLASGASNKSIHIYTRSDACGAASSWAKFLDGKQEDLRGVGVYGDPGLLEAARRDPLGIGYSNFSYVFNREGTVIKGVRLIPIDANGNDIADTSETYSTRAAAIRAIESGAYPVSRRNYFFVKGKPTGLVKAFITFALSDEGAKIVEQVGASLPLRKEDREKVLESIK